MFQGSTQEQHYTRLYSCKHFRNRVIRLQTLCAKLNLDAILLVIGIDTYHDEEMKKLQNWLLYGLSASDIRGSPLSDAFSDSFVVVSKDSFQAYINSSGFKELSNLTTLLTNCNMYTITKSDENDSERQEVIKVAKFYEMVFDKKVIGMPVRRLTNQDYIHDETQLLEKWPIIQAYGLDMVGGGFFTMKHKFINIRDELDQIYTEYDSFAIYRMVYDEIERFNQHFYDNFFAMNRDTPQKRTDRTEHDLIESFWLRYEFSKLTKKAGHTEIKDDDGLPVPRALIGINTNKPYQELSSKEDRLYKFNLVDQKDSALHFTVEFTEKNNSIRFARSYFLTNLSLHYMQGYTFSEEEEDNKPNPNGRINELHSRVLLNGYISLIKTFQDVSDMILKKELNVDEAEGHAFAKFAKMFAIRCDQEDLSNLVSGGRDSFKMDIRAYDTLGNEVPVNNANQSFEKKLLVLRMQISNITSPFDQGTDLGSLVIADTFFYLDQDTSINLTKNIPLLQFWFTSNKHYENLPLLISTEKNLYSEKLGERQSYVQDMQGLLPVKEPLNEIFQDINLIVSKLVFYQKGFILVDQRLYSFVLSYEDIEHIYFYLADDIWMEVKTKHQKGMPANLICEDTFFLKVPQSFFNEKFKLFTAVMESGDFPGFKVEKKYQQCPYVHSSQSYKNFEINKKFNKLLSCDYINFQLQELDYREILEFFTIGEFNKIRSKEFISFPAFHAVYQDSQKRVPANTSMFLDKLKQQAQNSSGNPKVSLIVISGVPGSGKSKLAEYLTRQLANENIPTATFKMPNVTDCLKFSTPKFIQAMLQFKQNNDKPRVVCSVLPSYNHLKKIIFELKKSQEFSEVFDIKYIITKVHARNFYMNKNRNTFQFLIENCMKGVTQAIIFEKSNVNQQEIQLMQRSLENANFEQNILPTSGRTFKLEDLAVIVVKNHDKLNILYNKYFYGFEKEGKSAYFQEKQVQGAYFNYRYPFNEQMLSTTIICKLKITERFDKIIILDQYIQKVYYIYCIIVNINSILYFFEIQKNQTNEKLIVLQMNLKISVLNKAPSYTPIQLNPTYSPFFIGLYTPDIILLDDNLTSIVTAAGEVIYSQMSENFYNFKLLSIF